MEKYHERKNALGVGWSGRGRRGRKNGSRIGGTTPVEGEKKERREDGAEQRLFTQAAG